MGNGAFMDHPIAAIATFPAESAIGIIRVSGRDIFPALEKICEFKNKSKNFKTVPGQTVSLCLIKNKYKIVDEALVSIFKAPDSYTGEDMAEISVHGNPFILYKIINLLMESGFKIAEPGEFTKRAFLNGKMDLSQAEAVLDVISAKNDQALSLSINQLQGKEKNIIKDLRDKIIDILSKTEAEIDFAYEDLEKTPVQEIKKSIEGISVEIEKLIQNADKGMLLKNGIKLVITGKPNTGKSSLLNCLVKKDKAIVTHIPGTTRDIIEDTLIMEGLPFRVFDTAGIRKTKNKIEAEGVKRARQAIKNADIVIFLADGSRKLSLEDFLLYREIKGKKYIIAINKSDLKQAFSPEALKKHLKLATLNPAPVCISALKKKGINDLTKAVKNIIIDISGSGAEEVTVTNLRHKNALISAKKSLQNALKALRDNLSHEFIAADVKEAASAMGSIIGEVTAGDILENIFKKFCIGK